MGAFTSRRSLKVDWSDTWTTDHEGALATLPEMEVCSHELFRMLAASKTRGEKRNAVVTENGSPVAVVSLRRRKSDWVPVTHYIVPGALFPVAPEATGSVVSALGVDLHLAWWRQSSEPPRFENLRSIESIPTYKMVCGEDMEAHWRRHHRHLNDVRRMRRRCEKFIVTPDHPAALEWIVRGWEAKWRKPASPPTADLEDRIVAAKYLAKTKAYRTLAMKHEDKMIAGITFVVHGDELVAQYCYRDPAYDWYGVGIALLDHSLRWATEAGYAKIDLGGDYSYHKRRWGRRDGEKWHLQLASRPLNTVRRMSDFVRGLISRSTTTSQSHDFPTLPDL